MRYGYFDDTNKEYVIDRVDVPNAWTNYIGVEDMCAVLSQNAAGYVFYRSPQYHRITRFRPNAPIDGSGHYVYIRDDDTGAYWSISWQPVGMDLQKARYECRHGLSYSKFSCDYDGIFARQTVFIPLGEPVELWDVLLRNDGETPRHLSVFSYLEFSFHHIEMDNQNFQMSLYASGSSYQDGIIEYDLFYEQEGYQWFAADFAPDSFDCLRSCFLGAYHDERNPTAVINGCCSGSFEKTGNHCAALHKRIVLQPHESKRMVFMLSQGRAADALPVRKKYADFAQVDAAFADLAAFWAQKLGRLQVCTPSAGMNTSLNIWNLYQSEVNVMFSRFASFIEVGGRTGLGYRDSAQDAMTIPHSNPKKCKQLIIDLLRGLSNEGYGVHLFRPEWFDPDRKDAVKPFKSPTVIPEPSRADMVHGIQDACSDDALWLIGAIAEYIKETGEIELLDLPIGYAQGDVDSVYEHMMRILDFSDYQVGEHGICKGLRADWNDCLNLSGGESALVSFLHYWALMQFLELSRFARKTHDLEKYQAMAARVKAACDAHLWDTSWYIRGITQDGRKIGTQADLEGKVHLESNAWAVLSGASTGAQAIQAMDSVYDYLFTQYGLMLNAPSYTQSDDQIGFVTRVYPGVKENGAIFSHSNPWAWCAEAILGRGDRAMALYDALLGYHQNDKIEIREAEPYTYCQFIMGKDHTAFGRARHPFMTGSGGWAYFAATRYLLGIRPGYEYLTIDPCIPADWKEFSAVRKWRGTTFNITVQNPHGVQKGVQQVFVNGQPAQCLRPCGGACDVLVVMGEPNPLG